MRFVLRTHERQHRRVQQISVIQVLEQAHRQAEDQNPRDDRPKVAKLGAENVRGNPIKNAERGGDFNKGDESEAKNRGANLF